MNTIDKAKAEVEALAKQDVAAGEMWSKAVRYNKVIQKLKKERDEARKALRHIAAYGIGELFAESVQAYAKRMLGEK